MQALLRRAASKIPLIPAAGSFPRVAPVTPSSGSGVSGQPSPYNRCPTPLAQFAQKGAGGIGLSRPDPPDTDTARPTDSRLAAPIPATTFDHTHARTAPTHRCLLSSRRPPLARRWARTLMLVTTLSLRASSTFLCPTVSRFTPFLSRLYTCLRLVCALVAWRRTLTPSGLASLSRSAEPRWLAPCAACPSFPFAVPACAAAPPRHRGGGSPPREVLGCGGLASRSHLPFLRSRGPAGWPSHPSGIACRRRTFPPIYHAARRSPAHVAPRQCGVAGTPRRPCLLLSSSPCLSSPLAGVYQQRVEVKRCQPASPPRRPVGPAPPQLGRARCMRGRGRALPCLLPRASPQPLYFNVPCASAGPRALLSSACVVRGGVICCARVYSRPRSLRGKRGADKNSMCPLSKWATGRPERRERDGRHRA